MPYKKKSHVCKKKRSSHQSWLTKYVPRPTTINFAAPGLGRSVKTQLKTEFFANVVHAATGIFTGYLRPGSCFDPCGDISTLQPAMYDEWARLYARYLVTDATISITFMPQQQQTAAATTSTVVAAYPSTVATALATFQGAASQPYSQTGQFGTASGQPCKFKFKLNAQKIVGSRLPQVAEDGGALIGADPATGQNMVLPIFIQHVTAAAGEQTVMRVKMIQTVLFDQKIQNVDG